MAPPYRDSFPSDHDDLLRYSSGPDHLFFSSVTPPASSYSSSLSFPRPDHSNRNDPCSLELKNEDQTLVETGLRFTIWKQIENSENSSCCENNHKLNCSSSSSKIRLVINSNRTENGDPSFHDLNRMSSSPSSLPDQSTKRSTLNDDGGAIIRTCSDCNTTKTPLWRSGPRGPKSLCNACGIRQRKARRAMAAAAANGGNPICGGKSTSAVVLKTNKSVQRKIMKKKCKDVVVAGGGGGGGGGGRKKLISFEEEMKIVRRLGEISSAYQRVFPQDEREAAILLMTLSYGLLS